MQLLKLKIMLLYIQVKALKMLLQISIPLKEKRRLRRTLWRKQKQLAVAAIRHYFLEKKQWLINKLILHKNLIQQY